MVILNKDTQLFTTDKTSKEWCFCVTSQGAKEPVPVSTVLKAASEAERTLWMKAIREAITGTAGTNVKRGLKFGAAGRQATMAAMKQKQG